MKRKIALLTVVSILAACVGACGNGGSAEEKTSEGNAAEGSAAKEESTGENTTVYLQWPSTGSMPAGFEDVEAEINKITEAEIGVTVVLEPVDANNLASETSLAISSGQQLDLCLSLFTGVSSLVSNGSIIPMDDLIEEHGADILAQLGDDIVGGYYDGQLYGVCGGSHIGGQSGFMCRKDILDKYDIEIDEDKIYTMEEMEEIFATVQAGEGSGFHCIGGTFNSIGQTTMLQGAYENVDTLGATVASGVLMEEDLKNGDYTIKNMFATDQYKEYADLMYDWAQKGYFAADAATNTILGQEQVKTDNYLGWFTWVNDGLAEPVYESQIGVDLIGIETVDNFKRQNDLTNILWSIPITSENPEKAMDLLNLMYKDARLATLLQFGIEGQSYEIVEDGDQGVLIKVPDGFDTTSVPYWQVYGVYGDELMWPTVEPATLEVYQNKLKFAETVESSPVIGYSPNLESVSTECAAVSSVVAQYQATIDTGAADPSETLPEMLNALEAAGIDKIIEENQSQLDEWLASK